MANRLSKIFVVSVFSALPVSALADGANVPLPKSMAALGDSLSAAAFANFRRQDAVNSYFNIPFFMELGLYGTFDTLFPTDTLHNSIIERRYLSWSSGEDPLHRMTSHASRLAYMNGDSVFNTGNFAITGGMASDVVNTELPQMMEWSKNFLGQAAPDYVTLLIGNNDICTSNYPNMTPVGTVAEQISYTLDTILSQSPNTRILLSSIPQLYLIPDVLAKQTLTGGAVAKTCADMWAFTGECPRILQATDPSQLAAVKQMEDSYFSAFHEIVAEKAKQFGDRIRFSSDFYQTQFTPDEVAMDCFHPNYDGQNHVAEATFKSTWWADAWNKVQPRYDSTMMLVRAQVQRQNAIDCEKERNSPEGIRPGGPCSL